MFEKFQTPFVSIELRPNTALQLTRSASLRAQLNATVSAPTDGKVLSRRVARVCKRCKSMDQKRANELVGRGNSFHRANKYEQAIAAYEEAIKLFPAYGSFKLVYLKVVRSAEWLHIAPLHCTYGYDVIATIGWQRQTQRQCFVDIFNDLIPRVKISESQVRHLYYQQYHPLLACHEREHLAQLRQVSEQSGLLLSLDGLAPEGGEPQLWVVRELRTTLTIRSGWLSRQDQTAFEHFLEPIAELGLQMAAILSDKQRGLLPAVQAVFPGVRHAFCQPHYLKNIAEPIAEADQGMKVTLRKTVRQAVGDLIRAEQVENKGV